MKVLVLGKGAREHALVWKLKQSPRVTHLFCAPGNAGTAQDGNNVPIEVHDLDKLLRFAKKEQIDLTIVGPEEPLALGVVDQFERAGLRIFGPSKAAAQLESSKVFAKELMRHADIPTAEFRVFDHPEPARRYAETRDYPLVVKADGLAAGKGVVVCSSTEEALAAIDLIMVKEAFGTAGRRVVIEKRLDGKEISVLALVSGRTLLQLPVAEDYKKALDGDQGPNTGGMGAFSPSIIVSPEMQQEIENTILIPTVHALKRARMPFRGVLYAGLMMTQQGPRVLEFNVRFGDPETQPTLLRLKSDLLDLLEAVVDGRLDQLTPEQVAWDDRPAIGVVLASQGYPGSPTKGKWISGLNELKNKPDVQVFHAGTKLAENRVVTDGGRVLTVCALGNDLVDARAKAYAAVEPISFQGMQYRKDIGLPRKAAVAAPD